MTDIDITRFDRADIKPGERVLVHEDENYLYYVSAAGQSMEPKNLPEPEPEPIAKLAALLADHVDGLTDEAVAKALGCEDADIAAAREVGKR